MSVIRIKKARDKPYVILDTTALNDARLSFRAKGLHTYLMAKPDDWQIHIEHLEKQSPREARDAIRAAMQELETCGYIRRQRIRGEKGRMMGWDTTVYETPLLAKMDDADTALSGQAIGLESDDLPITDYPTSVQPTSDEPTPDQPTSDCPTSVQPSSANPQLLINDSTQYGKEPSIEDSNIPISGTTLPVPGTGDTSGLEVITPETPPKRRLPKGQQPGELHPNTIDAIQSMSVEAFHCLTNPNKLNEIFWDSQITLIQKARVLTFAEVIAKVDAYYSANEQKWPLSEVAARKRMGYAINFALEQAQKRTVGRRSYA